MSNLLFGSSRALVALYSFSKKQKLVDTKNDRRDKGRKRKRMDSCKDDRKRKKKVDTW